MDTRNNPPLGRPARVFFLSLMWSAFTMAQVEIHVAATGDDDHQGTAEQPVQTLVRALELVGVGDRPATVWLADGTYSLPESVLLPARLAGRSEKPFTIAATNRHKAILSGGAEIPSHLFVPLSAKGHPERLPESARTHVLTASFATNPNLHAFFTPPPADAKRPDYAMLTWRGYTLQQARWPNRGYAYMGEVQDKGPTTRWGWDPVPYSYDTPIGGRFLPLPDGLLPDQAPLAVQALASEFARTHDMTIEGYLSNDWYYQHEPVGSVDGTVGAIQLLGPTRYGIGNPKMKLHRRFFIRNTLCQLDEPGEWYYDYAEKRLYLWPVEPPTDTSPVRIAGGPPLLTGKGLKHVALRGLVFENFGSDGLVFEDSDYLTVAGCEFRSGIGRGLRMNGTHNTITGCDFHGITSALSLSGRPENRLNLLAEHNSATNNHIHHCRRRGYGLLYLGGVGVRFAHNLLHDQNGGIFYGDNDAVLEYNEFYNMGYEMGDWNVAYNGADLTKLNNQFRANFVHHLMETPNGYPVAAFRADDGGSGMRAIGNILYKCGRSGFEFHGPANEITGNVLMNTQHLWWTLQRPYEKVTREHYIAERRKEDAKVRGTYVKEDVIGKAERLLGTRFWAQDSVWTQRFPHLKRIFELTDWESNPWMQGYCRIEGNFLWRGRTFPIHAHGRNAVDSPEALLKMLPATATYVPSRTFDPKAVFVAADQLDFRIRPDAVLPEGFPRIEFEKIGLYVDEHRPTVPDKTTYRQAVAQKYRGIRSTGGRYDRVAINRRYSPAPYLAK
jgi:hypothetical protein